MSFDSIYLELACVQCGEEHTLEFRATDFVAMREGKHVQDAAPYLTAGEREMMISGFCEKCFDDLFEGDDEDA